MNNKLNKFKKSISKATRIYNKPADEDVFNSIKLDREKLRV